MFLKRLQISNNVGVIRDIPFHAGMNLIVDETPIDTKQLTGNNVGKTTVLMLIDFCLGGNGKDIYTDPENPKKEYTLVKNFLIETEVLVKLTLTEELGNPEAKELVIERNFLPKKHKILRINGLKKDHDEFEETLVNQLFPDHYGKKPTFRQIISHNIRYKELSITNTLKTLNKFTKDEEYEALHLFLFGCQFDQSDKKQKLLEDIRLETNFKKRLEAEQTRSAYEASFALLSSEILQLEEKKTAFYINPEFEKIIQELDDVRYKMNIAAVSISKMKLRYSLIQDTVKDIKANQTTIDMEQLKVLYADVSEQFPNIQKTFEELVSFHNTMLEEKTRYIAKDIPKLEKEIKIEEGMLRSLRVKEEVLVSEIKKSGTFEELEELAVELSEKNQRLGEIKATIKQFSVVDKNLKELNDKLTKIDLKLFSKNFEELLQAQLNKFNTYFSKISQELYNEKYALKFDIVTTKTGKKVYKISPFNVENFSSGKKQGEITCFDIAYNLFADNEGIPCYHFLLNDKKELMHDNQLTKIASLVEREKKHVQFIASILKDKLPVELNQDNFFVLKLSQQDKLFRIESGPA